MFFKRKQQQNINNEEYSPTRTNDYCEQMYQNEPDENDWDFSDNNHQQDWENTNQTLNGDSLRQNHHYSDNNDEDRYMGNHYMEPNDGGDNEQSYNSPSMAQDDQYQVYYQEEGYEPMSSSTNTHYSDKLAQDNSEIRGKRAKYHAKIDQFLTNGIIIVGVLLLAVLLIAFLG